MKAPAPIQATIVSVRLLIASRLLRRRRARKMLLAHLLKERSESEEDEDRAAMTKPWKEPMTVVSFACSSERACSGAVGQRRCCSRTCCGKEPILDEG